MKDGMRDMTFQDKPVISAILNLGEKDLRSKQWHKSVLRLMSHKEH